MIVFCPLCGSEDYGPPFPHCEDCDFPMEPHPLEKALLLLGRFDSLPLKRDVFGV